MSEKMTAMTIAVLMASYNRKEKTLTSLDRLFKQVLSPEVKLEVYLVDDGSTDWTAEAVSQIYPQVNLIQGTGKLFWNGGMRCAFAEALKVNADYYLWLNDYTLLYPDTISKMLTTFDRIKKQGDSCFIVVGSTCDPDTGRLTYGGMVRSSWWHPLKFRLLEPTQEPQPCHTMNGNCVLIPGEVAEVVGNLDSSFIHSTGDMDYGLRVRLSGGSVWLVPGYIGTCATHAKQEDYGENQNLNWLDRFKKATQAKGLPLGEWKVFAQRHARPLWPLYWGLPSLRLVLAAVFGGKMGSQINA